MKSFSVTTKNLTDRPYLSHKSADNLSEDLPLLSVSVSLKMARMGRSTDIHNLPPYRGYLCSAVVGPQGGEGKTFRIHNLLPSFFISLIRKFKTPWDKSEQTVIFWKQIMPKMA